MCRGSGICRVMETRPKQQNHNASIQLNIGEQ